MSSRRGIDVCPYRANIDYSHVQYSNFSQVQFYEPSESEVDEDNANGVEKQGEFLSKLS